MTEAEKIKQWFTQPVTDAAIRRDGLSIAKIEEMAGLPKMTLRKYLDGVNPTFPNKHLHRLVPILMHYGYKPVSVLYQFL